MLQSTRRPNNRPRGGMSRRRRFAGCSTTQRGTFAAIGRVGTFIYAATQPAVVSILSPPAAGTGMGYLDALDPGRPPDASGRG
jgi:hypothetical protein